MFLAKVGIVSLFSPDSDLSGMGPTPSLATKVTHKAVIEVNEGGAEAAAVTGNYKVDVKKLLVLILFNIIATYTVPSSGMVVNPRPPFEFRADHPFIFYLMDLQNESIPMFVGSLNNPISK